MYVIFLIPPPLDFDHPTNPGLLSSSANHIPDGNLQTVAKPTERQNVNVLRFHTISQSGHGHQPALFFVFAFVTPYRWNCRNKLHFLYQTNQVSHLHS